MSEPGDGACDDSLAPLLTISSGSDVRPDTLVRRELEPDGKKTKLRLVHSKFADRQGRDDNDEGWDVYFLEPMKEWLESKK